MPITRKFLDWRGPALSAVVDFLCEEFVILGVFDLENVVVVLPGSRTGRRLLELLVERAEKRLQKFTPPQIITIGTLSELLYEPKRPFAGDLVQKLAWGQALLRVEPGLIAQIIPKLSAENVVVGWLPLGEMLWRQHRELAAASLHFEVHNERRFAVREGDTRLLGSIDRLTLVCHDDILVAADVIDFKTDVVSAGDESALAETVEYYRGQLESYRPAVAAMYGLSPERISAKLLFVGPGIVRNV